VNNLISNVVGIVGLWHLGCVLAAGLSSKGIKVIGYDSDKNTINNLNSGKTPIFEPNLSETICDSMSKNLLRFTYNIEDLSDADFIWFALDTPIDDQDNCDTSMLEFYMTEFNRKHIGKNFIVSSQVPCGTCDKLIGLVDNKKANIAYIPENFQLGNALEYFNNTDFWVIGSNIKEYLNQVSKLFKNICKKPMLCDLRTAEMLKHALNSFFATVISFSNSLSELAVEMRADAYKVVELMKMEKRIGKNLPLMPGPWFSGGTLARDVRALQNINNSNSQSTKFFESVLNVNNSRIEYLLKRLREKIAIKNKNIAILGMIYKNNTNTLRRSPGIQLYDFLIKYGVKNVLIYDNLLDKNEKILKNKNIEFCDDIEDTIKRSDIVIILRSDIIKNIPSTKFSDFFDRKIVLDIPNVYKDIYNNFIIKPGN